MLDAVGPRAAAPGEGPARDRGLRRLVRLALGLRTTPVTPENAVVWARLYALVRECRAMGVKLV